MAYAGGRFVPDFVHGAVDKFCPAWWKEGCGACNRCFGVCADGLETVTPVAEQCGNLIWIFGSPLAFPLIFCFPAAPHTRESSGYEISMLEAPTRRPITCCWTSVCIPCAQWHVRRQVLGGDMSKYKLWQGYHDGPHCCARRCPGAPITIQAGSYGEQDCPNCFLCLEVCVLGGMMSTCCAFDVSRRYQRTERGLGTDPTEHRQHECVAFFSRIMHKCFQLGCCCCATSCLVGVCAPDSSEAQNFAGQSGRAARACCRIAHILWKGILWTRVIGMGCMTTQMLVEADTPWDGQPKQRPDKMIATTKRDAPSSQTMQSRGAPSATTGPTTTEIGDMLMPWEEEGAQQPAAASSPQNQRMNR